MVVWNWTKWSWVRVLSSLDVGVATQLCESGGVLTENDNATVLMHRRIAHGGIAQLGERLPCKQDVRGSSPLTSTAK